MENARSTRWCGDLTIHITHSLREGAYACRIAPLVGESVCQVVGEPRVLERAVDDPEAFDDAAHAALSFAAADCRYKSLIEELAAMNGSGWHIGRTYEERWPCSSS